MIFEHSSGGKESRKGKEQEMERGKKREEVGQKKNNVNRVDVGKENRCAATLLRLSSV